MTTRQNIIFAIGFICYLAAFQTLSHYGFVGFAAGLTGVFFIGVDRFNRKTGAYAKWSPFWKGFINAGVVFFTVFGVTGFAYEIYKFGGGQ